MIQSENKACRSFVWGDTLMSTDLEGFPSGCWNWASRWAGTSAARFCVCKISLQGMESSCSLKSICSLKAAFIPSPIDIVLFYICTWWLYKGLFKSFPIGKPEVTVVSEAKTLVCGGVRTTLSSEFSFSMQSRFLQKPCGELPACQLAPDHVPVTLCCSLLRTNRFLLMAQAC